MKKTFVLLAIILLGLCCSCGSATANFNSKYISQMKAEHAGVKYIDTRELTQKYDVEIDAEILYAIKDIVKEGLEDQDFSNLLNWEKFDRLGKLYYFQPEEEIIYPDKDVEAVIGNYIACYNDDDDSVEFFQQIWVLPDGFRTYVVMHEISHSLLYSENKNQDLNNLIEGMTDLLATKAAYATGRKPYASYNLQTYVVEWLGELYGMDFIIESLRSGSIADFIDDQAYEGATKDLNLALQRASNGDPVATNAALEILCLMTRNSGNVSVGYTWTNTIAGILNAEVDKRDVFQNLS